MCEPARTIGSFAAGDWEVAISQQCATSAISIAASQRSLSGMPESHHMCSVASPLRVSIQIEQLQLSLWDHEGSHSGSDYAEASHDRNRQLQRLLFIRLALTLQALSDDAHRRRAAKRAGDQRKVSRALLPVLHRSGPGDEPTVQTQCVNLDSFEHHAELEFMLPNP